MTRTLGRTGRTEAGSVAVEVALLAPALVLVLGLLVAGGRAYGTNCHHEHACLRCVLLRPDPAQIDRLRDIINLHDRIHEAEQVNWLGEVEGLKISAAGAQQKLDQMTRQLQTHDAVDLGMPKRRT